MSAAEAILAAIRGNLPAGRAAPVPPPALAIGDLSLPTADRLRQFAAKLQAVGAGLHVASPQDPAAAILQRLLQPCAGAAIGWSDAVELQALRQQVQASVPFRLVEPHCGIADLLQCEAGVTTAQWGIASTGTLVLPGGGERHRLLSLLPPLHIAVLPSSRLLATLGEALKTLPRPLPAAVTFVTGPSRTADIELQLVVGVHGPRQLHVVLV